MLVYDPASYIMHYISDFLVVTQIVQSVKSFHGGVLGVLSRLGVHLHCLTNYEDRDRTSSLLLVL